MTTRYSRTTGSFYPFDIDYLGVPEDVIVVSQNDYIAAMNRPTGHLFDFVDGKLVISAPPPLTFGQLKEEKWGQIKLARSVTEAAGFTYDENGYDSDPASIQRINGAVTTAMLAKMADQPFQMVWTLSDNSTVTLDAQAMISVGVAAATHVGSLFDRARILREQIDDAKNAEDLDKIHW